MNIGIIDADLVESKSYRFPNLASMKLSSFHKNNNHEIKLLRTYDDIAQFDKVYISKVFTETKIDTKYLELPNVEFGGTGFFMEEAEDLPHEIEHSKPDYSLYNEYLVELKDKGATKGETIFF